MSMTTSEKIRLLVDRQHTTITALAEATGQSRPNLSSKLSRGNFSEAELRRIAAALGCTLSIEFITPDGERT